MRFRLVTLLLTTTIIALLVGWAVDRCRYTASLQKELTEHITGNVNIQSGRAGGHSTLPTLAFNCIWQFFTGDNPFRSRLHQSAGDFPRLD